jgi:nitrate reductase alpha subunit
LPKNVKSGEDISPKTTLKNDNDGIVSVGFPYFNNKQHDQEIFTNTDHLFLGVACFTFLNFV